MMNSGRGRKTNFNDRAPANSGSVYFTSHSNYRTLYAAYWNGAHAYHHTASASLHYGLLESLRELMEETLEGRFARHRANASLLWQGLESLGATPFIPMEYRLPPLTTASVPPGVDPHKVRARLLEEFNIEIAAGFGALKDRVWRIGLMGYSSRQENISLLLDALKQLTG